MTEKELLLELEKVREEKYKRLDLKYRKNFEEKYKGKYFKFKRSEPLEFSYGQVKDVDSIIEFDNEDFTDVSCRLMVKSFRYCEDGSIFLRDNYSVMLSLITIVSEKEYMKYRDRALEKIQQMI